MQRILSRIDHPVVIGMHEFGAALAAVYRGELDRAEDLNHGFPLTSPSRRAWHHYISGEIAGRRGDWETAASQYRVALDESRTGGVSFVAGVATVGLLSAHAATGRHRHAVTGYLELLEHYERTGGWQYQWTTLQNVADLLDKHDEPEVAAFLRDATSGQAVRSGSANTGTGREQVVAEARRVLERLRDQ